MNVMVGGHGCSLKKQNTFVSERMTVEKGNVVGRCI